MRDKVALHGRNCADGVGETAVIMPAAAQQAGLVEVNVGVDEAGQDEPAFNSMPRGTR